MHHIVNTIKLFLQKVSYQPSFSVVLQSDESECGLAALTMIARAFGASCELEELRQIYGSTRGGMTIGNLCDLADLIGLEGEPKRCDPRELTNEPTILFVKGEHFSVLWKVTLNQYFVADPADGLISLSHDEFTEYYSGIIISFRRSSYPARFTTTGLHSGESLSLKTLFLRRSFIVKIMVVLAIISTICTLLNAGAQDVFMTYVVEEGELFWTKWLIVATIILSSVLAASSLLLQVAVQRQLQDAIRTWNVDLFTSILRAPYSFFVNKTTGLISSRLTQVNDALSGYQSSIVMAFTGLLNLFVYLVAVLLVSPPLAITSLVGIAGFIYVGIRFYGYNIHNNYILRDAESAVAASEFKLIGGRNQIVIEGAQSAIERDLSDAYIASGKAQLQISRVSAFNEFWLCTVDQLLSGFLLIISSVLIINGSLTTGTYAAINVIIGTALEPVRSLSAIIETIQNSRLTFRSASEMYQPDSSTASAITTEHQDSDTLIELKDLTYSYSRYSEKIIKSANLKIRSKTASPVIIRLDGGSGSGKSTFLSLLMGLIKPTSGSITVFGSEVSTLSIMEMRKLIQYVDRSPLIINGSVESNARLGVQCSTDDYKSTLQTLGLHQEPLFRRQGSRYLFDETSISTGQGVMINLVRAALMKPRLLLIDESLVSIPENLHQCVLEGLLSLNINLLIVQHGESPLVSSLPTLQMDQLSGHEISV
jgi:ABC-type bacteriocin/lantibiotic exporter with double-glycine peptidase domain